MSKFEYQGFVDWTDGADVRVSEFHDYLFRKHGSSVRMDVYDKEYSEYLWRLYEKDNLFESMEDVMEFIETALFDEYSHGEEIHVFQNRGRYQVTLDPSNKLQGWKEVEL